MNISSTLHIYVHTVLYKYSVKVIAWKWNHKFFISICTILIKYLYSGSTKYLDDENDKFCFRFAIEMLMHEIIIKRKSLFYFAHYPINSNFNWNSKTNICVHNSALCLKHLHIIHSTFMIIEERKTKNISS